MEDIDDIIPELEVRYENGITDTEHNGDKETYGKKQFAIQISRTYPVFRELPLAGAGGGACLIRHNGLESILKFYRSETVPNEEAISKAKKRSERLHDFIIHIYEYGFDDNSKRWYVIQEYAKYGSLKDLARLNIMLDLAVEEINHGLKVLHEDNILHLNLKPSNILIREKQPPHLVFTDFDMSSIIEYEQMKRVIPLKGGPLYSSPELLTGISGKEADYWALGMILLELLEGKHPFGDLDDKSIADIISAKGLSIPEHVPEDYKILLRGLLTRDSKKRWGHPEIERWLGKDTNIPVHFIDGPEKPGDKILKGRAVPYRFLNEEYFSIEEMIPAFLKSGEAWESAEEHLCPGHISKWLLENFDKKKASQIDNITEQSAGDQRLAVISLIYTFKKDLPFIIYGEKISRENLYRYAGRCLKNEASKKEKSIIQCLLNGKLAEYHLEYMMLTSKEDYDLINLFEAVRKAMSQKDNYPEKLNTVFKMLDILANPNAYAFPADISDNVIRNLDFIANNIDSLMTREKYNEIYNEILDNLIIPEEMKEAINNDLSSGPPLEYLKKLDELKKSSLLTKSEFNQLQEEYIVPAWLESDLIGKEASKYVAAVRLLRKLKGEGLLINKNDFLDYLKKYYRFIGHVVDKNRFVQHVQKGDTFEQKWVRLLKCDMGNDGYIKLAKYIKNNVMLSMILRVEEIIRRVSAQTFPSDSMNKIVAYLEALKSSEVTWSDSDKQIVDEVHSIVSRNNTFIQFLENMTEGAIGKFLRNFLKIFFGIDADERTREMESSLAGIMGGACIGVIVWMIIVNLELEMSFYGPVVLGLLLGLVSKSIPLALLSASAGFAGVYFLGLETLIEVIYAFAIAITGAAKFGAFLGRKINKISFYDGILTKYDDRIQNVVNAVESSAE
jgi:serine/threonine protein kinase